MSFEKSVADDAARVRAIVRASGANLEQRRIRSELAAYAAGVFEELGKRLHVVGHVFGSDRDDGKSKFDHGNDEAVAISFLLLIASQLISASAELLVGGRQYAGAALLRQLVEVEYLAWAFETRDEDAAIWLRSDKKLREGFFRPAKLREAAKGKFRSRDYGFHCELGGHPVPQGTVLLQGDEGTAQLLLSDLLGHAGRIWDHLVGWARAHDPYGLMILTDQAEMLRRFQEWKASDQMVDLPPP